ncbi:hypothetical protein JG687_00008866 [Phytophthora cactorum]|uniref:Uncharacterized protein n=1 Tax=Phytophthora cactorum TaxID=29920 RepID=A0A8T1UB89_9STRA|nr:hypothetical protein JG687_00008866 [Phytophthora cactorum]
MLLPRDMEMIDDCICDDGVDTTAQEAAADAMDTGEFICKGRYKSKRGAPAPRSFADCDCYHPYEKDPKTLECVLNGCPRAGNYEPKPDVSQSNANCKCVYGLNETIYEEEDEARRNAEDQEVVRKRRKECNTRPVDSSRPDFSQCPHDSMATTWPAESADGCTCLSGLEMTPLTEQEISRGVGDGFHCVATKEKKILADEAAAACRAPGVIHSLSGECRLPIEEIPEKKTTDTKPEGVLFKGIEYHYELVDDTIMVIQGDVAIGERFVWDDVDPADPEEVTTRIEHASSLLAIHSWDVLAALSAWAYLQTADLVMSSTFYSTLLG